MPSTPPAKSRRSRSPFYFILFCAIGYIALCLIFKGCTTQPPPPEPVNTRGGAADYVYDLTHANLGITWRYRR